MIEVVLMCFKEIAFPEDLETLLIKFFGPAFKIIMNRGEEPNGVEYLRPTKRQKLPITIIDM